MKRILSLALITITLMQAAHAHDYVAGQHWKYRSRPGDESSVVIIDLVEKHPTLGAIYHVSVLGVLMPTLDGTARKPMDLPHFPVSKQTLDASVIELSKTGEVHAAYRQGYDMWKEAFDAGKAGIFTVTIAECIDFVEQTVTKNRDKLK